MNRKQAAIEELIALSHEVSEDFGARDLILRDLCFNNSADRIRFFIGEHRRMHEQRESDRAAQAEYDRSWTAEQRASR